MKALTSKRLLTASFCWLQVKDLELKLWVPRVRTRQCSSPCRAGHPPAVATLSTVYHSFDGSDTGLKSEG